MYNFYEISTFPRTRPLLEHEAKAGLITTVHSSNPHVLVSQPTVRAGPRGHTKVTAPATTFSVDMAFGPEDDTDTVYSHTMGRLLDTAARGGVATMFAYGQTGSGKTHTVVGVMDRLAGDLFTDSSADQQLHVSFIQLLGNAATDLLGDTSGSVGIMEDKFGKITMVGAQETRLQSSQHFLEVTRAALGRRTTSTTFKNDTSSRSHAVCRIR